jgi:hypothetical protein
MSINLDKLGGNVDDYIKKKNAPKKKAFSFKSFLCIRKHSNIDSNKT